MWLEHLHIITIMSHILDYQGHRIDETSQILLQILRDYGREADVRTLREEADLDQSAQIHYRVDNHLGPDAAGFIEDAGMREVGGQEMTVYRLTETGRDWVEANEDDVLDAVGAAEAVESINRMQESVSEFDGRLDDIEDEVERMDNLMDNRSSRLTRMKNNINDLEDALMGTADREDVIDLASDLDDLEQDVEALQSHNRDVDDRLDTLEDRMERSFENVDRKLSALYERQERLADADGVDLPH